MVEVYAVVPTSLTTQSTGFHSLTIGSAGSVHFADPQSMDYPYVDYQMDYQMDYLKWTTLKQQKL